MIKVIEYVLLGFGIVSLYACGCFLTKEIALLTDVRMDIDMQLARLQNITGERRKADFEIE